MVLWFVHLTINTMVLSLIPIWGKISGSTDPHKMCSLDRGNKCGQYNGGHILLSMSLGYFENKTLQISPVCFTPYEQVYYLLLLVTKIIV